MHILAHGIVEALLIAIPYGTLDNCIGFGWQKKRRDFTFKYRNLSKVTRLTLFLGSCGCCFVLNATKKVLGKLQRQKKERQIR